MRIKKPPFIRAVFWFDKILQGSLWNVIVNFQVFDPFEVSDVFGDDWYAELESCCGDQEIDHHHSHDMRDALSHLIHISAFFFATEPAVRLRILFAFLMS